LEVKKFASPIFIDDAVKLIPHVVAKPLLNFTLLAAAKALMARRNSSSANAFQSTTCGEQRNGFLASMGSVDAP